MKMSPLNIAQIVITVALTLGVIILLIYIVATGGNPDETGLMRACWQDNGQVNFNWRECTESANIEWPREDFPLIVTGEPHAELLASIDNINNQMGCMVLQYEGGHGTPVADYDILVEFGVPLEEGVTRPGGGTTFYRNSSGRMTADIDVYAYFYVDDVLQRIVEHELGHALGLGHDINTPESIMYPSQGPGRNARFTSDDVNLISGMYCSENNRLPE